MACDSGRMGGIGMGSMARHSSLSPLLGAMVVRGSISAPQVLNEIGAGGGQSGTPESSLSDSISVKGDSGRDTTPNSSESSAPTLILIGNGPYQCLDVDRGSD